MSQRWVVAALCVVLAGGPAFAETATPWGPGSGGRDTTLPDNRHPDSRTAPATNAAQPAETTPQKSSRWGKKQWVILAAVAVLAGGVIAIAANNSKDNGGGGGY